MEITPEIYSLALMYLKSLGRPIKKIKVKSEFYDYLEHTCPPIYLDNDMPTSEGIIANFTGIPIVIDDEIESEYYEIEF